MRKLQLILLLLLAYCIMSLKTGTNSYLTGYVAQVRLLDSAFSSLLQYADATINTPHGIDSIRQRINSVRLQLKASDIWLRYLEPIAYKKLNGPLPVEWENEVFEKHERPYRREGAGLSLAWLYLNTPSPNPDTLHKLIADARPAFQTFLADSITSELTRPGNLLLCNRLYLLNLATIYTTGFDCPDDTRVIPELQYMMQQVRGLYLSYNAAYPSQPLSPAYLALYDKAISFVATQSRTYHQFDHFTFIRSYINPLFALNRQLILDYNVVSKSYNDYSLNNQATGIFDKQLYTAQNALGIYSLVEDSSAIRSILAVGKLLFYDPILSGNNERSCASCHKPTQFFTDTTQPTAEAFAHLGHLDRNTPTLLNAPAQHLLMLDGRLLSLQAQALDVITNPREMGSADTQILQKVLSCKEYKNTFRRLLRYTPEEKEITLSHITSAVTAYYAQFSNASSSFDNAIMHGSTLSPAAISGFNLFMGKAKCATCHYLPQFGGVPPPYINSEFEVVGTPADTAYHSLCADKGRYLVNPAPETLNAFRVPTVRNAAHTMPYMHNGVFSSLQQLIDFYDAGGGAGHGLSVPNQTLSSDSLHLSPPEKQDLITFIHSLDEHIIFDTPPTHLPAAALPQLRARTVGGLY